MDIKFDKIKTLTIDGKNYDINEIYAFDIAEVEKKESLRIITQNAEITLLSTKSKEEIIKALNELYNNLKNSDCKNFTLLDDVIVNLALIKDSFYGKGCIVIEFENKTLNKQVDKALQSAFLNDYDNYVSDNLSATFKN